ncbi:hypothetical protein E9228_003315 [Curtobacterium flaccumfaciens]|uniref:Uncharacterized protein n=1 Tax=Curtobacterium salicis TaxID=1779862 RepID=A0ABX0TAW8_9MICO|nr:hypothetical protein [Curtobacterium sp. WW7]NII42641.1 hypothetical protein [Curtobacterium sp. WW7]
MHDRSTTHPLPGAAPATSPELPAPRGEERCPSRFDRWLCGLQQAHGGLHVAEEQQGRTTWNDALDGRDLSAL